MFSKVGCRTGSDCEFCHLAHPKKNRSRPCKAKRLQSKQLMKTLGPTSEFDLKTPPEHRETPVGEDAYRRTIPKGMQQKPQPTGDPAQGPTTSLADAGPSADGAEVRRKPCRMS